MFFRKNVFQSYERAYRVGLKNRSPRSLTLSLDIKKILTCPKIMKNLFLDLREFFKNRGLTSETSDFDFCGLLDKFFHMAQKHFFEKKLNFQKLF